MNDPKLFQFDLDGDRPDIAAPKAEWYPGIKDYWPSCTSTRRFNPVEGIRALVIHATAGGSSSGALWGMKNGISSFHYLIPDENEQAHGNFIWRTVPRELAAWHVQNKKSHPDVWSGNKLVNHWSIGIELVNLQDPKDEFSDWQMQTAAKLARYLWSIYPNLKHVVSHAKLDPKRRSDPGELFDWIEFENLVLNDQDDALNPILDRVVSADEIMEGSDDCCNG